MPKSKLKFCSGFLLFCLCFTANAWAAEKMPPVEVRAKMSTVEAFSSPVSSVIKPDDQIPAGQINDLTDLLSLTNSIYIQDSAYGRQLYLRGLSDQDMRVLIDGMPLGQMGKYYARSLAWEAIPLENIERIEVIRGAGSVEYGNTLVGTINIITRQGQKEIKNKVSLNYGTFNDFKAKALNSGSVGKVNWAVSGALRTRDEYLKNNDIEKMSAGGSVGVDLGSAGHLQITGFALKREEGLALDDRINWSVWSDARDYMEGSKVKQDTNTILAAYTSDWFDLGISYMQHKRDDDYRQEAWQVGDTYDYTLNFKAPAVKAKLHHKFGSHSLKLGGEYSKSDGDADWTYYGQESGAIEFDQDLAGAFVEDSWQILPKLNLTFGLRYDYFKNKVQSVNENPETQAELDDDQISPRGSLTYDLPGGFQAFAFAGQVYKAPAMADMYRWSGSHTLKSFAGRAVLRAYYGLKQPAGAPAFLIPPQYIEGWKSLMGQMKPVKGWDYELGVRRSGENHAFQVNLFYQDLKDYITIYPVSYPPTYNVDKVRIWGAELSGVYTFNPFLEVEANYTFTKNKKEGDEIIEKLYATDQLFNAPEHLLNLTLRSRPVDGLLLEWQSQFVSSRFAGGAPAVPPQVAAMNSKYEPMYDLDPYWLHNVRGSYTLPFAKTDVTFSLAVENLFNEECYVRLDYPLPGTLVYGGVSFTF